MYTPVAIPSSSLYISKAIYMYRVQVTSWKCISATQTWFIYLFWMCFGWYSFSCICTELVLPSLLPPAADASSLWAVIHATVRERIWAHLIRDTIYTKMTCAFLVRVTLLFLAHGGGGKWNTTAPALVAAAENKIVYNVKGHHCFIIS